MYSIIRIPMFAADTLGLSSYWQSDYSRKDVNTAVDDAHMTFYETFAALSSLQVKSLLTAPGCTFTPTKVWHWNYSSLPLEYDHYLLTIRDCSQG